MCWYGRGRTVRGAVIAALCVAQVISVLGFVCWRRKPDAASRQAEAWLRANADPGARVLSPELSTAYYGGCNSVWDRPEGLRLLDRLFCATEPQMVVEHLRAVSVRYVLVPKDKVSENGKLWAAAGYSSRFVQNIPRAAGMMLAFESERFYIWGVMGASRTRSSPRAAPGPATPRGVPRPVR